MEMEMGMHPSRKVSKKVNRQGMKLKKRNQT